MIYRNPFQKRFLSLLLVFGLLSITGLILGFTPSSALGSAPTSGVMDVNNASVVSSQSGEVAAPNAACSGGPVIDGVTLDECVDRSFTVGGTTKNVRVWYTKNVSTVQRTVNGTTYNLTHYINNDTDAQDVAQWAEEAWQRYWEVFGHHPNDDGCSNRISVKLEDLVWGSGVAYWWSSGSCWIGIDSPTIRGGSVQGTVYHEFQHYLQYSYNSGCYKHIYDNYDSGSAAGNAEFVDGYADLAEDSVDATLDATLVANFVAIYDPEQSFYDKRYNDVFNKYFSEQLGSQYATTDPHWHFDAVREHYEECDAQDTFYVLDTLVPTLDPNLTEEKLFMNFFAANWAKDWADATTQPELVYFDDDTGPSYGSITLYKDVNISSGTQSWSGESTPDDWAARYYQVKPQSGCGYVTASVDGAAGAHLGINLMAADTSAPTSVKRTGWIGEDLTRTFPGHGTYNRIVAVVNAFDNTASYDVSFSCVNPVLDILEPRQANFALVGDPTSPIAFLARFKVTSSGSPVLGLTESSFTADAEGDAITVVPGSFSQVGEEYWVILLPPTKPAGTEYVDLEICLDGSICDTETDALRYVDPGNTDFALVFDASNSMNDEDIPGEGTRVENARKAGIVLADLLRIGDRILVTDFSARNDLVGCGLPYGDGNCPLDLVTHLVRTDVVNPASNAIAAAETAITNITGREWTPIGAALWDAKNQLVATPASGNPMHIILLSDGEENVNPLYASVKGELVASGVVIDTVRFGDVDINGLTAQIAADTGGSYTFVPTTPGTLQALEQSRLQLAEQLTQMGVPSDQINRLSAVTLPGPLGLDNVYDYYETRSQSAARLLHENHTGLAYDEWTTPSQIYVDESVNVLRIVVASKQADYDESCEGDKRDVIIAQPGIDPFWVPVSPPDKSTPSSWEIRHSLYDDVVIIPNPAPGIWQVQSRLWWTMCAGEAAPSSIVAPAQADFDVMINSSAETNIQLVGRFLPPILNNQGNAGDYVPIVATLLDRNGAIPDAEFCLWLWCWQGLIPVTIEKPGGTSDFLFLWDDGLHNDGSADDGVYGELYRTTNFGGTYNVRMVAYLRDPANTEQFLSREWNGSFYLFGPPSNDQDGDGMPDDWERRCDLNTQLNDAGQDNDQDGLSNIDEFNRGTLPCQADTDHGGERDGSEVNGFRNPLDPNDDLVLALGHISVVALNQGIRVQWTHPISYTNMIGWLSTEEGDLGERVDMGNSGVFTLTGVINDLTYFVRLSGQNDTAEGEYSDPFPVTPKADPVAPNGGVLINNGAMETRSKNVTLFIGASDNPLEGLYQSDNARLDEISGNIEMRISNNPSFTGAVWEPLDPEKPWTLADGPAGVYIVYAQFRDGALNESLIVYDTIIYTGSTFYLPMISK